MKVDRLVYHVLSGALCASVSDALLLPRAVIEKCPNGERSTFLIKNRIYNICPGTDYWSPNIQVMPNTASVEACVTRCSEMEGCAKASYNLKLKVCYLKGDPATPIWHDMPDLDTIQVANVPECPSTERSLNVNGADS